MIYYEFQRHLDDYYNHRKKQYKTFVKSELLTEREFLKEFSDTQLTKFLEKGIIKRVNYPRSKTYFFFGCRFGEGEPKE